MEQAIEQIKVALANSISIEEQPRKQALEFLQNQCEPNPEFQLALLQIISSYQEQSSTAEDKQLQYQAIICMKNSITRLLQAARNRRVFRANQGPQLPENIREEIKSKLLDLVQNPENRILGNNAYEQLALVVCIFVKYDFPAKWQQLNSWLLQTFEQLYQNLGNLQMEQIPKMQRFLSFYLVVMKEQNKKKLVSSKGQFHKVAKEHLSGVYKVWNFFNEKQSTMIYDQPSDSLILQNYNQVVFDLASKLDKCLMIMIACGFSLNELLNESQNNLYVQVTGQLIQKLQFFAYLVEKLSHQQQQQGTDYFYDIFENQIKTFLKHLCELQQAESLIIYDSLQNYIETVAQILVKGNLHKEKQKRLSLLALYRVVNTRVYNQQGTDKSNHSEGIGILVSPSKFKNFEPQLQEASDQYRQVFEKPDPNSPDPKVQTRKDGAREMVKLVFQQYLPLSNINIWSEDPEQFIELEDENYFMSEYDLDSECSISLLSYQFLEKLISSFYDTCYEYISETLYPQYFNGQMQLSNDLVEDSLLSLASIIGKIQKDLKVRNDKRLDISYILDFIYQNKWQNPIFKRRFTHILASWAKILPKQKFLEYYQLVLNSLKEQTDYVLIYEHCYCLHEMLKEINLWLKKSDQGEDTSQYTKRALFNFADESIHDEDYQIKMSKEINNQIDFSQVFSVVAQKLVPILGVFKSPTIIWNLINYISILLEKNSDSQELMVECFNTLNIHHLLSMDSNLVDEAVVDMLKNLLVFQPNSSVILQMCSSLLDFKLTKKLDSAFIKFWLFTVRAVSNENPTLSSLQQLITKFIGFGESKRDYIVLDFLKILQEGVLLNFFTSQQDVQQMMQYVNEKFLEEIEREKQWMLQNQNKENISNDSDEQIIDPANLYEKKLNLIIVPHIFLLKSQSDKTEVIDFIISTSQNFIVTICQYLVTCQASKTMPSSSNFFTQIMTYINRIIIIKRDFFVQCLGQIGYNFEQFIEAWFSKMDFLVSQESQRINLISIYTLLPLLNEQLIKKHFNNIARRTFFQLDSYMLLKMTDNQSRFYSPSKFENFNQNLRTQKVRINQIDKVSQRLQDLKKYDTLLTFDIVDHFLQKMEEVKQAFNLQSLSLLSNFLSDANTQNTFANLISGNYQVAQE